MRHSQPARTLATLGAGAVLAFSLAACGSSAPSDASKADFCKAVTAEGDTAAVQKAVADKDYDALLDELKKTTDNIEKVGTPENIPDDAREGFEIQLDAINDLKADDIKKSFEDPENAEDPFAAKVSKDDKKKIEAFEKYQSKECEGTEAPSGAGSDSGSGSSDMPSDMPSMPTDIPSDLLENLPSDLPTDPSELASLLEEQAGQ